MKRSNMYLLLTTVFFIAVIFPSQKVLQKKTSNIDTLSTQTIFTKKEKKTDYFGLLEEFAELSKREDSIGLLSRHILAQESMVLKEEISVEISGGIIPELNHSDTATQHKQIIAQLILAQMKETPIPWFLNEKGGMHPLREKIFWEIYAFLAETIYRKIGNQLSSLELASECYKQVINVCWIFFIHSANEAGENATFKELSDGVRYVLGEPGWYDDDYVDFMEYEVLFGILKQKMLKEAMAPTIDLIENYRPALYKRFSKTVESTLEKFITEGIYYKKDLAPLFAGFLTGLLTLLENPQENNLNEFFEIMANLLINLNVHPVALKNSTLLKPYYLSKILGAEPDKETFYEDFISFYKRHLEAQKINRIIKALAPSEPLEDTVKRKVHLLISTLLNSGLEVRYNEAEIILLAKTLLPFFKNPSPGIGTSYMTALIIFMEKSKLNLRMLFGSDLLKFDFIEKLFNVSIFEERPVNPITLLLKSA